MYNVSLTKKSPKLDQMVQLVQPTMPATQLSFLGGTALA